MTTLRAILLAVLTLWAPGALAQLAPEGNAHPESRLVNATDETALLIPFALPTNQPTGTPDQKRAFAEALDLDPLRDLAVGHNGRVKILDTLARESVRMITGRKDYIDIIPASAEGAESDTYKPDPLFTLLDMVIDPAYYADKPLIHVEYLPLRRALLEKAYPGDEAAQQRWNKRTRLAPDVVEAYTSAVFNEHADEIPFRRAVNSLDSQHSISNGFRKSLAFVFKTHLKSGGFTKGQILNFNLHALGVCPLRTACRIYYFCNCQIILV